MIDIETKRVSVETLKFESRLRVIRLFVWLVAMPIPIYMAYELAPFMNRDVTISRALSSPAYKEAEKQAYSSISEPGQAKVFYFEYPASELTTVSVEIGAKSENTGTVVTPLKTQISLRADRAILWTGTFAVLLALLTTLLPTLTIHKRDPLHIEHPERFSRTGGTEDLPSVVAVGTLTPVDLFASEVKTAAERADALFARSTLLLAGGIVMAFIGVGIFYVTLPETQRDETLASYWPKIVRPTGVLIFVEAIAWFLLRQYRALVEDYKWFYRLYLKRANYLAALRILSPSLVRPEDIFVAASLIQEDLSGRLKSGETTESLENLKSPEESPVTEILRMFTAAKDKTKVEKTKSATEKSDT